MAGFRQTDVRRVQSRFDAAIEAPYESVVAINEQSDMMTVRIMDPDEPDLCVWQCRFDYVPALPNKAARAQPDNTEVDGIVEQAAAVCEAYPAQKVADAEANARRVAIAETILENKAAEANARAAAEARAMLEASKAEVPDDVLMAGVREAIIAGIANRG